ncbi:hypothetical protein LCGC14_2629150, partial [marine sediment metagenome]
MSEQLFTLPQVLVFDINAALVSGAKANFYIAGTLTRQNTYTDSALTTPHANPVVADGNGLLDPIYLDATLNYKVDITDSLDSSLEGYPVDNLTAALTAAEINDLVGEVLYPATAAENTGGITPTDTTKATDIYDVLRVGIVPDDSGSRAANTTALKALLDPSVTGPVGNFIFPNVTGATTYYFDDIIQIRPGCHLDLCHCTIDFAKTYASADD